MICRAFPPFFPWICAVFRAVRYSSAIPQICAPWFFAVYRVIRYRGAFSLVCSPDFSQYSVRLGTAEPFFKFVLLVFRNLPCVQVQQRHSSNMFPMVFYCIPCDQVQRCLSSGLFSLNSLNYVVQTQEISCLCLKSRQMQKSMQYKHKKPAVCA